MNKVCLFATTTLLCLGSSIYSQKLETLPVNIGSKQVVVNNKILAKVLNHSISVVDVTKYLDLMFARQFPDLVKNPQARYEFYQANWQQTLQEMINKELVLQDAKEIGMEVSDAEVRQDLQEVFGPNVHDNLEALGIPLALAWKDTHDEMILQRMMMYRVRLKGNLLLKPQYVKEAYDQYILSDEFQPTWTYQIIAVRGAASKNCEALANELHTMILQNLSSLENTVQEFQSSHSDIQISLSKEYINTDKQLSNNYKEILSAITPGTISEPKLQSSRDSKETLCRIFFLKSMNTPQIPPFAALEKQLETMISRDIFRKESAVYISKLRDKHGIAEQLTSDIYKDFTPFSLR